jgi:type V secretory pathway adhesin AidA
MKSRVLIVLLLAAVALAGEFRSGKLLDVVPYEVKNSPLLATNTTTGTSVLVDRGTTQMFTITVALDDMSYSANFGQGKFFKPSELVVGDSVQARIEADKIVLKDSRGKEVRSPITRRARLSAK